MSGRVPPGVRFMALSALFFALMSVLVKSLGARLPTQEIVFARSFVSLALSYWLVRRAGVPPLGTRRGLLVLRGLWGFAALSCVFYAVSHLPLAEATVIQYLHPVFTAVLAAIWLGERPGRTLGVSLALSISGVLLVTRPGFLFGDLAAPLDPVAAGVALLGAFFSACAYVGVRSLTATEHPLVVVLYFPLVAAPASLPGVLIEPVMPLPLEWLLLAGVGVFAQLGQVFMTEGLKREPAARATALSYLQIVFAAALGALFFGERPGPLAVAGAALIGTGTWIAARSAAAAARPRAAARAA